MATALERFWQKVDKSGECWLWTGAKGGGKYGQLSVGGKRVRAHRWIYEQTYGPLPLDIDCCHKCDIRLCVRPDHLFAGTRSDNMQDCAQKGRHNMQTQPGCSSFHNPGFPRPRGEGHGMSKLTASKVLAIRELKAAGESSSKVAAKFGVSKSIVSQIARREVWAHV